MTITDFFTYLLIGAAAGFVMWCLFHIVTDNDEGYPSTVVMYEDDMYEEPCCPGVIEQNVEIIYDDDIAYGQETVYYDE